MTGTWKRTTRHGDCARCEEAAQFAEDWARERDFTESKQYIEGDKVRCWGAAAYIAPNAPALTFTTTLTITMTSGQLHDWECEYGLSADQVADDARDHLTSLITEAVNEMPHMKMELATLAKISTK